MLSLFDGYPEKLIQISSYILANGGVRRDLKLRYILKNIVDVPLAEDTLSLNQLKYARRLENLLAGAPMVECVETFLVNRNQSFCFNISSSMCCNERRMALSYGAVAKKTRRSALS